MALQMVRSFFGQGTPSRSRAHEPIIGIESLGNQEGNSSYDRGDVGKSAASNWFELARHPTSELGGKPHSFNAVNSTLHCCANSIVEWQFLSWTRSQSIQRSIGTETGGNKIIGGATSSSCCPNFFL